MKAVCFLGKEGTFGISGVLLIETRGLHCRQSSHSSRLSGFYRLAKIIKQLDAYGFKSQHNHIG